jgi:hypothetical protein
MGYKVKRPPQTRTEIHMSKALAPSTKADIKADFLAKPSKYAGLTDAQRHSIVSRGQVSGAAIAVFNKGRKGHRRYVRGQSGAVKATVQSQRAALVEAGLTGKRGPLSKAAQESLSAKG